MNAREFFNAVDDLRRLQKAAARANGRDRVINRCVKEAEQKIDQEIVRVKLLLRERQQPRLNL